jgi:integrase
VRVRLKGINSKRKQLSDGSWTTYYYAWKGGPRLKGEPGSPEFMAAYNAAVATKKSPPSGLLLSLLHGYQASDAFLSLGPRTQSDYRRQIKCIELEFDDFPISALIDRRSRGVFLTWRDELALKSRRQADYAWTVLARVLSWALERGLITSNPCERGGRLYRASRADKVWTEDDEANFLRHAPPHLHLPLLLALWTGQRQGDLLRLTWTAYDGSHIRLRQAKTGARVVIPVGAPLKTVLDSTLRRSPFILTTADGRPWTSDGFRSSWRKACAAAGIAGLTFHDLRGSAVTRLALAHATVPQIIAITGHSIRDVGAILDTHYLNRDPALAEEAIRKLETRTKTPDRPPDRE